MIVLDAGQIVEFGSPAELLQNSQGVFYGMCKAAGVTGSEDVFTMWSTN